MLRRAVPVPLTVALLAVAALAPVARADVRVLDTWGSPGAGAGQLSAPAGVTADDDGHVYVADTGNGRVQRFDEHGEAQLSFGEGTLSGPLGVAADRAGHVYVADTGNARIVKFRRDGMVVTSWSDPLLVGVAAVAVDPAGSVYAIGDAHRIARFDPSGALLGAWGATGAGDGQFAHPQGIAAAAGGRVFVTDDANLVVQPYTLGTGMLPRFGGAGELAGPSGIAADPVSGDLVVADRPAGVVQRRSAAGALLGSFGEPGTGTGQLDRPGGVAVDCGGTIYVADTFNHRIQRWGVDGRSTRACFPPVARLTVGPAAPQAGSPATLDATASSDEDGRIVRWDWQIDGPVPAASAGRGEPTLVHTFARAGTYTVRLRVTDDEGNPAETAAAVVVGAALDATIRGATVQPGRSLLGPWARVTPRRMSVAAFRRGGARVTVGRAPPTARSYTVKFRRAGRRGCVVARRTLRPDARARRLLRTRATGLAARVRPPRRAGRCPARPGRHEVAVTFAGAGSARAAARLVLVRPRR